MFQLKCESSVSDLLPEFSSFCTLLKQIFKSSCSHAPNVEHFLLTENAATLHLHMICFHAALLCRPSHHHEGRGCCRLYSLISFPLNKDSRKTSSSSDHLQYLYNILEYFALNHFAVLSFKEKKKSTCCSKLVMTQPVTLQRILDCNDLILPKLIFYISIIPWSL